jgi:hypothetical protein
MPRRKLAPLPFPPTPLDLAKAIAKKAEQLEFTSVDHLHKLVDCLVLDSGGEPTLENIESVTIDDMRDVLASPPSPFFAAYLKGPFGAHKLARLEDLAIALSREAEQYFSPAKGPAKWAS